MDSIVQSEKECLICRTTSDLHCHHVFFGRKHRHLSEKHGLKVWLCAYHHLGDFGPHHNNVRDTEIKKLAQHRFEELHSHEEFMKIFEKNYL